MQFQLTYEYLKQLKEAVDKNDQAFIKLQMEELHPHDIAEIFNDLEPEEVKFLYTHLTDEDKAAKVLVEMEEDAREQLLSSLSSKHIAEKFIDNLDSDDAADIIAELPEKKMGEVLSHMEDAEQASDIVELMNYEEGTAGSLMATELVKVQYADTIFRGVREVRKKAEEIENIYTVYVVDENDKLMGILPMKKLLITPLRTLVKDAYQSDIQFVKTSTPAEEVAKIMEKYNLVVLPVVDHLNRLVGRITIDDVVDVIREEETEDVHQMAGIEALDEPYINMTVFQMLRKRAGWLIILFIGESFTATAMGFFENQLAKAVVLALFVPLIISSGGNTGSQASTLVIRALALGEVTIREWWKIIRKELKVGLALGLILGLFGFLRVAVWSSFVEIYGSNWMPVAFTVGVSLMGVVMWGNIIGSLFPMILKRFGFDPAVSSAPFVATLVDVTGLIIYFSVAALFMSGIMY